MENKNNIIIAAVVIVLLVLGGWLIFGKSGTDVPTAEYSQSIVGAWRSVEYPQLVREFKADGVLTDTFGTDVINGTWELFDSGNAPEVSGMFFDDESVYVWINLTGEERDRMYFQVRSIADNRLDLLQLTGRSSTAIGFTRVEE